MLQFLFNFILVFFINLFLNIIARKDGFWNFQLYDQLIVVTS